MLEELLEDSASNAESIQKLVNEKDKDEFSPIHYASRYNHLEIVEFLINECHAGKTSYFVEFFS